MISWCWNLNEVVETRIPGYHQKKKEFFFLTEKRQNSFLSKFFFYSICSLWYSLSHVNFSSYSTILPLGLLELSPNRQHIFSSLLGGTFVKKMLAKVSLLYTKKIEKLLLLLSENCILFISNDKNINELELFFILKTTIFFPFFSVTIWVKKKLSTFFNVQQFFHFRKLIFFHHFCS